MVGLEERDCRARDIAHSIIRYGHAEWLQMDSPEVALRRRPEDRPFVSAGSVICGACESGSVDHMLFFPVPVLKVDGEISVHTFFLCDSCLPSALNEAHLVRIAKAHGASRPPLGATSTEASP